MAGTDLANMDDGGAVGSGPEAARPEPTAAPGDRAAGWVKVGSDPAGGDRWPYADDAAGAGGPGPWRQT